MKWPPMWMYEYSKKEDHPLGQALKIAKILSTHTEEPSGLIWTDIGYRQSVMDLMVEHKRLGDTFDEASKEVLAYWVARRLEGE